MAQTIKLKRSATAGNTPTTSQLALGELGINTTDGKLFLKKSVSGTESIVDVGGLPLTGGTLTGNLSLSDNVKAQFGASNDLQIYHDGSNSYIAESNATGNLFIKGTHISLQNSSGQDALNLINGDAYIKSGGQTKLQTTSTGIDVTGSVVADKVTVGTSVVNYSGTDLTVGDNSDSQNGIAIQTSTTGNGYILFGDGSGASSYRGEINYSHSTDSMTLKTAGTNRLNLASNGDISFYNDSAAQGLFWDSSTSRLGLGTTAPNTNVQIYHATDDVSINVNHGTGGSYPKKSGISFGAISTALGGDTTFTGGAGIQVINTAAANAPTEMLFFTTSGGAPTERFKINADGSSVFSGSVTSTTGFTTGANTRVQASSGMLFLNGPSALAFEVGAGSEKMRLTSTGLGIGTTSVNAKLHVSDTTAPTFRLSRTGTGQIWQQSIDSSGRFILQEAASEGGTKYTRLQIDDTGEATFSGSVTADDFYTAASGEVRAYRPSGGSFYASLYMDSGETAHLYNSWSGKKLSLTRDGNVNIGSSLMVGSTTAPTSRLHIKAASNTYTGGILIEDTDSLTKSGITHVNGGLYLSSNATNDHLEINSSGNALFSGSVTSTGLTATNSGITLQSGSVTKSAISVAASTNQGINGTSAGDQYNWTNGGKMLWSTNNGTNAHLVLDSSGNATFSGSVTATNTILNTGSTTVSAILRGGDGNSKNLVFQKQTGSAQQAKISAVGDDLRFSTGSAEQLKLDQNGNLNLYNGSLMVGSTTAPTAKLDVVRGGTTGLSSVNARTVALFQNNNSAGTVISINAPATGYAGIFLGDDSLESVGQIKLDNTSNTLQFVSAGGSPEMTIQSNNVNIPNGSLMVGSTTAPSAKLQAQVNNTATPAQIATDSNAVLLLENTNASGSAGIRLRGGNGAGVLMYGENNSTDKFYLTPRNDTGKSFTLDHVGNGVFQGSVTSTGLNVTSNTPVLTFTESDQSKEYQIGSYGAAFAVFDATANAFRYVIDTSGNVGIGVSDPDVKLEVSGSARFAQENHSWTFDDTINNRLGFVKKAGNYPVLSSASGIPIIFSTSDNSNLSSSVASQTLTERMRIASNGTLYHGKTADSLNTGGLQTLISGQTSITQSYTEPLRLNRMSSQGAIQKFYYNGGEVGSIGSYGGHPYIGGDNAGNATFLRFWTGSTPSVRPSTNSGTNADNTLDLGSSAARFKDLYLSNNATAQKLTLTKSPVGLFTIEVDGTNTGQPNLIVKKSTSEALRIDNNNNLLVGKTSLGIGVTGTEVRANGQLLVTADADNPADFNRKTSDGVIALFRKDSTTVGSIGTLSGRMAIGSGNTGLFFDSIRQVVSGHTMTGNTYNTNIDLGRSVIPFKDLYLSGGVKGNNLTFSGNGSAEHARVDTSGNLLVGTTSSTSGITATSGSSFVYRPAGELTVARQGSGVTSPVAIFNQTGDDGQILDLRKNGTTVGSIGTVAGDIVIGTGACGIRFHNGTPAIQPRNSNGNANNDAIDIGLAGNRFKDLYLSGGVNIGDAKTVGHGAISLKYDLVYMTAGVISPSNSDGTDNDNAIDLGKSSARFDDIFATNGTIQTSDRNEKQDIEDLTEAEERVAIAAKGLLKKFRWKSAVEDKGDDARIHFGIIAQDLQDAFEAEGLDAGRYGMFISTTWTDEDGEEQTRMGVRYSELLAFIISAI